MLCSNARLVVLTAMVSGCAQGAIGGDPAHDATAPLSDADVATDGAVACEPLWRATFANVTINDIGLAQDRAYVAGATEGAGWLAQLSTCTGAVDDTLAVSHPAATESALEQIVVATDDVYAVGWMVKTDDPREGLYAHITASPMSVETAAALFGSTGDDRTDAVALAGSGELWMTGSSNATTAAGVWGVKSTTAGQACGFAGPAPATWGRAVVAQNDDVYLLADSEGHALIAHYQDAACSATGPCACAPDWTAPLQVGLVSTLVLDAAAAADELYVVGTGSDSVDTPVDLFGFAVRLDTTTGAVLATYRWDITALGEGLTAVALDADAIYIAGGQGWDGDAGFAVIEAAMLRLSRPLTDGAEPTWTSAPQANVLWSIAAGGPGDDGVYAAGLAEPGTNVALRCNKTAGCAE